MSQTPNVAAKHPIHHSISYYFLNAEEMERAMQAEREEELRTMAFFDVREMSEDLVRFVRPMVLERVCMCSCLSGVRVLVGTRAKCEHVCAPRT